jgi:hypothetical protein
MRRLSHASIVQREKKRKTALEAAGLPSTKPKRSKYARAQSVPAELHGVADSIQGQLAVKGGTLITYDEKLFI